MSNTFTFFYKQDTIHNQIRIYFISHKFHSYSLIKYFFQKIIFVVLKKTFLFVIVDDERARDVIYFDEVYLVTALVPSDTACLASSPGNKRRTAVWISRLVMVERLL